MNIHSCPLLYELGAERYRSFSLTRVSARSAPILLFLMGVLVGGCAGPRRATVERLEMREQLSLDLAGLAEPFSKRLRIDSLAVSGDSVALFLDPRSEEAFYREADIRLIEKVADSSLAPYGKVTSDRKRVV